MNFIRYDSLRYYLSVSVGYITSFSVLYSFIDSPPLPYFYFLIFIHKFVLLQAIFFINFWGTLLLGRCFQLFQKDKNKKTTSYLFIILVPFSFYLARKIGLFVFLHLKSEPMVTTESGLLVKDISSVVICYLIFLLLKKIIEARDVQVQNLELRLSSLNQQINPHFLFNTLNTITYHITQEPSKAEKMTIKLSKLYRKILSNSKKEKNTLYDELKVACEYLDLEKMRFENKMDYRLEVSPDVSTRKIKMPILILQPLVENSVKHGISPNENKGEIKIIIDKFQEKKENGFLILIKDTGRKKISTKSTGSQTALENSRQRLKILYGNKASVQLKLASDKDTELQIKIPNKAKKNL